MRKKMNHQGFTLLEFIIAFALLTIILSSVYITQSSSLFASVRTKNIVTATNLARNIMAESEIKLEGVKFDNISKEETGNFEVPFEKFKWKRKVEEVDFSSLAQLMAKGMNGNAKEAPKEQDIMVAKLFEDYMKKSVRKMLVTIEWPEGNASSTLSFTTLLVNYDADFATGM